MNKTNNVLKAIGRLARTQVKKEFSDIPHCKGILHQPKRPRVKSKIVK